MPRPTEKPIEKKTEATPEKAVPMPVVKQAEPKQEKPLVRHLVIIDGVDHTIMAADEADLQKKIAALRGNLPSA